jgi:hypothetical protein
MDSFERHLSDGCWYLATLYQINALTLPAGIR